MVKSLLVGLILMVSACATEQAPILTPIEVKVPIAIPVYCQVAKLDKPALPLAGLSSGSAPDDTIRAYAATVAVLKGAVVQRDLMMAGCAAPPGSRSPENPGSAEVPSAGGAVAEGK
jgi:hypothetical protein